MYLFIFRLLAYFSSDFQLVQKAGSAAGADLQCCAEPPVPCTGPATMRSWTLGELLCDDCNSLRFPSRVCTQFLNFQQRNKLQVPASLRTCCLAVCWLQRGRLHLSTAKPASAQVFHHVLEQTWTSRVSPLQITVLGSVWLRSFCPSNGLSQSCIAAKLEPPCMPLSRWGAALPEHMGGDQLCGSSSFDWWLQLQQQEMVEGSTSREDLTKEPQIQPFALNWPHSTSAITLFFSLQPTCIVFLDSVLNTLEKGSASYLSLLA